VITTVEAMMPCLDTALERSYYQDRWSQRQGARVGLLAFEELCYGGSRQGTDMTTAQIRRVVTALGIWMIVLPATAFGLPGVASALHPAAFTLVGEPRIETVANASDYFPDSQGSVWRYRGHVSDGPLEKVSAVSFENTSTVKGTDKVNGVTVKVFLDTNPGNHGPSQSYYRRDAAGIVYYGSEPGTTLEKQLVPYQIVRFPMEAPSSFEQFNRKGLNFGNDLDGDENNEQADVEATVVVHGKDSVTVPAGTYPDAIRIEARMTIRIRLSASQRTAIGTDNMTAWFARGVGLVKYVERQQIPPFKTDRGWVSEITEELEEVTIKPGPDSASMSESVARRKASPDRVLTDHASDHELNQVVRTSGFRSHSR
jgi:hypothetical protein